MVFLSPYEIFQAVVMSLIVGWIFMDILGGKRVVSPEEYMRGKVKKSKFWFAVALVAPAIILHELGHKFVAMAFGLDATFQAAWIWLGIGIIMKMFGGFIFLVPAFVKIVGTAPHWVFGVTALAGPAVNFALFGLSKFMLWFRTTQHKSIKVNEHRFWTIFARINLFLGAFNLIPIPPFDGGQALLAFFF